MRVEGKRSSKAHTKIAGRIATRSALRILLPRIRSAVFEVPLPPTLPMPLLLPMLMLLIWLILLLLLILLPSLLHLLSLPYLPP